MKRPDWRYIWHSVSTWQYFGLFVIVALTIVLHFGIIRQVDTLIFDEQHYVADARNILSEQGDLRPEHPPLSKVFIVAGMAIFGDNPIGWRMLSIVAATMILIVFYLICRRLRMSDEASLLATFLLSLENLTFIQGSIAMLDVFYLLFMLTAFLLYLNHRYLFSGIFIALSSLGKLVGVLAIPVIGLHWLWSRRSWRIDRPLILGLASGVAFVGLLPVFIFAITQKWQSPVDAINSMLSLSGSLTFANTTQDIISRPWQWILQPTYMWYWYDPHYMGAVSFSLWALIIPSVIYMGIRGYKGNEAARFGLCWFFGTYLLWIPMSIFTDRISFVFYMYPTVGSICIGVGLALGQLMDIWRTSSSRLKSAWAFTGVMSYLFIHVIVFIILAPVFSRWTWFIRP